MFSINLSDILLYKQFNTYYRRRSNNFKNISTFSSQRRFEGCADKLTPSIANLSLSPRCESGNTQLRLPFRVGSGNGVVTATAHFDTHCDFVWESCNGKQKNSYVIIKKTSLEFSVDGANVLERPRMWRDDNFEMWRHKRLSVVADIKVNSKVLFTTFC